eukprot:GHVQ01023940.1.p1 GENE.GHVQ01023940.1~~GHVQ01023940.1.p1  ORF type:complete len:124 (+),score=22.90 GHVQ01023940.1:270-641(+)
MRRILGRAPPPPPQTSATEAKASLETASSQLSGKLDHLDKQIEDCDRDLAKYKAQLQKSTPAGQHSIRQRAMAVLKKKKMYEGHREALAGTQMNLDQATFATEQLQTTAVTVSIWSAVSSLPW